MVLKRISLKVLSEMGRQPAAAVYSTFCISSGVSAQSCFTFSSRKVFQSFTAEPILE